MSLTNKQTELVDFMAGMLPTAPAEVAQKNVDWYKQWEQGEAVKIGDRRWSGEKILYEVYAEPGDNLYPPEEVPAIWKRVFTEEWPEWIQPLGAGTGYQKGAKVTHNDKKWVSTYDGENVWEPGVYGWDEVTE